MQKERERILFHPWISFKMKKEIKKKALILIGLLVAAASCKDSYTFYPPNKYFLEVNKVDRDTLFFIDNKEVPTSVSLSWEADINKTAVILYGTDSLFKEKYGVGISAGKSSVSSFTIGDFTNEKMFIKYKPLNDSTTGTIKIEVRFNKPQ